MNSHVIVGALTFIVTVVSSIVAYFKILLPRFEAKRESDRLNADTKVKAAFDELRRRYDADAVAAKSKVVEASEHDDRLDAVTYANDQLSKLKDGR